MKSIEEKYIELLLTKCLNFSNTKSLFISYYKENRDFIKKLANRALDLGINDIYFEETDIYEYKKLLQKVKLKDMDKISAFDDSVWDEYANKNACFLMLKGEYPGVLDTISPDKIAKASFLKRKSKKIYRQKQMTYECPWCIASLPNEVWAKKLFPKAKNAYRELFKTIAKICLLDKNDPVEEWNKLIKNNKKTVEKLNKLQIKELHYENSLGTDLKVQLHKDAIWAGAGTEEIDLIVNMPSFEVFTTPLFSKTNGIVYSSKPLIYNGKLIEDFYIEFKEGKVINFDAAKGKAILEGIINTGKNNNMLGEVALVNYDSPISNTGIIFETTLFDENASCHLALGEGFSECIKNGLTKSKKELEKLGINQADNHVDFMIGTKDLKITATTYLGKEIVIFDKGNLII